MNQNPSFKPTMKNERHFFLLAAAAYTLSAWFAEGFYHSDEHYTIIEFALFKMGTVTQGELTWEFDLAIKPALLPFLAFLLIKVFNFIHIADPYIQAFILRLLTALLAVFSLRFFIRRTFNMVSPGLKTAYLFLSYFLWFMPLLNVRFLAESLSGILLLTTLAILLNPNIRNRDYLVAGLTLGFGCLFRYPHALLASGIVLWLLFIRREKILRLGIMLSSLLAVLLFGVLVDFWLYGEFVLTSWNYFSANIIGDVAADYGTEAWWNYFYSVFRFSFFPIGFVLIFSFILLIIKKPRNFFIWTIIPYFLIHSLIPHKELRYLFPLAYLMPIVLILAYQEIYQGIIRWKRPGQISLRFTLWILLIINCIGVFTVCLKPSDGGLMTITHHIRKHYGEESIRLISYNGSNPYGPRGVMATYYMERDMEDIRLESLSQLNDSFFRKDRVSLLVLTKEDAESDLAREFFKTYNISKEVQCFPEWMEPLLRLYGGVRIRSILELYKLPSDQAVNSRT